MSAPLSSGIAFDGQSTSAFAATLAGVAVANAADTATEPETPYGTSAYVSPLPSLRVTVVGASEIVDGAADIASATPPGVSAEVTWMGIVTPDGPG
ncbi:MAG: hypothetical protein ACREBE_17870, partial [bacterium]